MPDRRPARTSRGPAQRAVEQIGDRLARAGQSCRFTGSPISSPSAWTYSTSVMAALGDDDSPRD
jgi:hypothetical protein